MPAPPCAQRRRRRPDRRHAGGDPSARRRIGDRRVRFTASDAARACSASACRQANEQVTQNNARTALIEVNDRSEKILHSKASRARTEVHPARGRRRQEPAVRPAAAHRREQSTTAAESAARTSSRPASQDARRALRLSRVDSGQRGSGLVLARPTADDRRFREQARRRTPHDRRPALVCRGRLGGDAGRRGAAGDDGGAAHTQLLHRVGGPADARRPDQPGHPDRRRRGSLRETVAGLPADHHGQSGARRQAGRDDPLVGGRQPKAGQIVWRPSATAVAKRSCRFRTPGSGA